MSMTLWHRLEPAIGQPLATALEARIHDPLWLLGRQWQLDELTGDDAGTAVTTRLRATVAPVRRFAGLAGAAEAVDVDGRTVLDAFLRAPGARDPRGAIDRGTAFVRELTRHGASTRAAGAFARAFPLAAAPGALVDEANRARLALFAGRVPDGDALSDALRPGLAATPPTLPPIAGLADADRAAALAAAQAWLARTDAARPPAAPATWHEARLEHRFAIAAHDGQTEHVLAADEHRGGAIDWWSFERTAGSLGTAPAGRDVDASAMPAPLRYRGMPAARWWELEDARVDFGAIEVGADDLGRLLLVEFGLRYGNDWLLVPFPVDVGDTCRIRSLVVVDNFGVATLVPSAASLDPGWTMFDVAASTGRTAAARAPAGPLLLVPPTAAGRATGRPVEDVALVRDEMANLVWGIERVVLGGAGATVDRTAAWARRPQPEPTPRGDGALAYRLASDVPEHWIPFVPVRDGDRAIRLRRGRVLRAGPDGVEHTLPPRSALLATGRPLVLHEEEVPREGVRVVEADVLARAGDGTLWTWRARTTEPGRGEGYAALAYDRLVP